MLTEVRQAFDALRKLRTRDQAASLKAAQTVAAGSVALLNDNCSLEEIGWKGKGPKSYCVFHPDGTSESMFSRAIRTELWIADPAELEAGWAELVSAIQQAGTSASVDQPSVVDVAAPREIDRLFYTAVVGFGAAVDLFGAGDRGGPGSFFEMLVGPTLSLLTARPETSGVVVDVPGAPGETERVPVDLSFLGGTDGIGLVVPTKISTRERISQAYVHHAILAKTGGETTFRTALCIGNENNMFRQDKSAAKSYKNAFVTDTLVPSTIVQYQRYIASLSGLYYLDPPHEYLHSSKSGFPPVRQFSALISEDLPKLLAP